MKDERWRRLEEKDEGKDEGGRGLRGWPGHEGCNRTPGQQEQGYN